VYHIQVCVETSLKSYIGIKKEQYELSHDKHNYELLNTKWLLDFKL